MKLKHYELICVLITVFLAREYAVYNKYIHSISYIEKIASIIAPSYKLNLIPTPGYPLSYFLGWLGLGLMLIMNVYTIRKRVNALKNTGKLMSWLEFHIFCGILGPILIVFHTNFKVEGLVSISFWSMVVASSSGIVGRYFYLQTLKKKEELKKYIITLKNQFIETHRTQFSDEKFVEIFQYANEAAGVNDNIENPFIIFLLSLKADITLLFTNPGKQFGLNEEAGNSLKVIGVENRRTILLDPFNQLLGYWHAFHLPFAFFMYFVAIIHIITALLLGVKH
jgi:hypothetical protein